MTARCLLLLLSVALFLPATASAIDIFFVPDTTAGDVGQVIQFSVQIDPTAPMRSFTVYMSYDTNRFDLYDAPTAGPVIAGHTGLQFNYFDHAPFLPDLLEVTATIFGTAFWSGPGELFTIRFVLRSCGNEPIVAPYAPFFVAADDSYPPGALLPALIRICPPPPPQAPSNLVIYPYNPSSVILRWSPVTQDSLGNPLMNPPSYDVVRQQILPTQLGETTIATVPDTFYVDPYTAGIEYIYHIVTESNP